MLPDSAKIERVQRSWYLQRDEMLRQATTTAYVPMRLLPDLLRVIPDISLPEPMTVETVQLEFVAWRSDKWRNLYWEVIAWFDGAYLILQPKPEDI